MRANKGNAAHFLPVPLSCDGTPKILLGVSSQACSSPNMLKPEGTWKECLPPCESLPEEGDSGAPGPPYPRDERGECPGGRKGVFTGPEKDNPVPEASAAIAQTSCIGGEEKSTDTVQEGTSS